MIHTDFGPDESYYLPYIGEIDDNSFTMCDDMWNDYAFSYIFSRGIIIHIYCTKDSDQDDLNIIGEQYYGTSDDITDVDIDCLPDGIPESTDGGQLAWIIWSQEQAAARGQEHTFIYTHANFCGHDDDEEDGHFSHDQNDGDFVEWANGLGNNPVEATFHGHTHLPWIFGPSVTKNNHDGDDVMWENDEWNGHWKWNDFVFDGTTTWYVECDSLKDGG